MKIEDELSDREALQFLVSTQISKSPMMLKLQSTHPRSAEEPTPGELHGIEGIESSLRYFCVT